jgi:hypothetical protein
MKGGEGKSVKESINCTGSFKNDVKTVKIRPKIMKNSEKK